MARAAPSSAAARALLLALGGGMLAARMLPFRSRLGERGTVVLITGGSRGLGLALAEEYLKRGARVAICARDEVELERARRMLETRVERSDAVLARCCDVGDAEQVQETVDAVERELGPIDVLVNNAGIITVGPEQHATVADFHEAFAVHMFGPLYMTRAVLPGMRARRRGRIVNISSIGGRIPFPHLLPYSASKAALAAFSEGLRAELTGQGVTVTTVCPGLMRTGSTLHARFKGKHRAEHAWFSLAAGLPLLSNSAERAARRIVDAARAGEADLILTGPALLASALNGLFPGATAQLLGLVNRHLMPGAGGVREQAIPGRDSESWLAPSLGTWLNDRAAARYNEKPNGAARVGS
jgi:NAD(P)-dependent dehydrogenase (short-subunit alcohol dehydrogenase family)